MKGVEQPMIIKKNVIQLKVFPVLLATTEKNLLNTKRKPVKTSGKKINTKLNEMD